MMPPFAGSVICSLRPENRSANFGKRAIAIQRYAQRQGDVALATHAHRPLSRPCEVGLHEESGRPEPGKAD